MSQQQWSARACPTFRRELADAYQARADRIRAMLPTLVGMCTPCACPLDVCRSAPDLHTSRKREKAPTRALGGWGQLFVRAGLGGEQGRDLLPPAFGHGFEGAFTG